MFAAGFRKKNQPGWRNVSRVSAEEEALRSWFEAMGWQAQYHVLTHVHTNKLPRHFDLDFANPENHLYVEVDGESHTIPNRRERDARRDAMLAERGWTGLRIPSAAVRSNIEDAKLTIATWIDRQ
jgi:very-short-patch-repair endonuclease